MKIAQHDLDERVFLIAEIGNNHEGDVDLAARLIDLAAEAGADAVKFQTFRPSHYISRRDPAHYARLEQFALPWDAFVDLAAVANSAGVAFLSTPFDPDAASFLAPHVAALKIASGDNDFAVLLERAAGTGRPLLLSTGLADIATVHRATKTVRQVWSDANVNPGLVLLHCVVAYPTPDEDANLRAICTLAADIQPGDNITVGYSDHTLGNTAALGAVTLGARVIEKHFTIAHDHSDFRDHQLSATPDEFAAMVTEIRRLELMLGSGRKIPRSSELANESAVRRSIVADRDLPPGHIIEMKDLRWIRPGDGLRCGREGELLGRVLREAVEAGQALSPASCSSQAPE